MFLQGMLARLRSLGSCLAICVKLPSAVRSNGRKAFALLTVLFMGVSVPVFATEVDYDVGNTTGAVVYDPMVFFYKESNMSTASARKDFFGYNNEDTDSLPYTVTIYNGNYVIDSTSVDLRRAGTVSSGYIDFIFSMPDSGELVLDDAGVYAFLIDDDSANQSILHEFDDNIAVELYADDVLLGNVADLTFPITASDVMRFSLRVTSSNGGDVYIGDSSTAAHLSLEIQIDGLFTYTDTSTTDPSDPSDPSDPTDPSDPSIGGSTDLTEVIDSITVVQGHLEEINGNVVEIKDTVNRIETEMIDTKEQLEDPTSPIWSAAGSAIGDAVTGLFVPDQAELDAKIDEVEQIIIDKLGDSYEIIETVEQYETELVNSFDGSSGDYAFRFPGISVPLPDGTVTILPEQDVYIENKAFIVFRDLLGIGVALLCGFSAVHILQDFVICILSGVSYWGFIRGRHDK